MVGAGRKLQFHLWCGLAQGDAFGAALRTSCGDAPVLRARCWRGGAAVPNRRTWTRGSRAGYDYAPCKSAPSTFFQTAAAAIVVRGGVDTVIVTGCTTSVCVRASGIDVVSFGSGVVVPEDCVGDVVESPFIANMQDVGRRYADAVDLAACLKQIARLPRSNDR